MWSNLHLWSFVDKEDYQHKAKALLEDQGTYKALKTDPTGRLKSKMINLFKKVKIEGGYR